jgi:hypothetical protein
MKTKQNPKSNQIKTTLLFLRKSMCGALNKQCVKNKTRGHTNLASSDFLECATKTLKTIRNSLFKRNLGVE